MKPMIYFSMFLMVCTLAIAQTLDTVSYNRMLREYVDINGRVMYKRWLENDKPAIDKIVRQIAQTAPNNRPDRYPTANHKLAAWINIYNILVIHAVLDHYPINSINDIPNVWKKKFIVGGKPLSLDEIEHSIIRPTFNQPLSHFALICAAWSCSKLHTAAFSGEKLDEELLQMSDEFFYRDLNFRLDKDQKRMFVSKLFEWYLADFIYRPTDKNVTDFLPRDAIIKKFIADHAPAHIANYVKQHKDEITVEIMIWNWKLNESF